jgi:hypothetical protein
MPVAAYTTSYTNRSPYLTVAEYQAAPTSIDTSTLGAEGLLETIGRASSWIDIHCCGAQGTLCATLNTETGRILTDKWGRWIVHPRYWPILEVTAFSAGYDPAALFAQTLTAQSCWIEEQQFIVSSALGITSSAGPLQFGPVGKPGSEAFAQWSYVNGWPNTTLNAAQLAGDTTIQPLSVVGIYPGSSLTIYDAPNDEPVQVAQTYVAGAAVVPLTTGLVSAHVKGVSVTALPPAVKQAAIFLTTALIKTRGSSAVVLSETSEPREKRNAPMIPQTDQEIAAELLAPFRVTWGQR